MYHHTPVLKKEVIKYLAPRPGQNFIDCTLGGGGHALELAKRVIPQGRVLGLDLDENSVAYVKTKKIPNLIVINDNYKNLEKIVKVHFKSPIHGILLDLGLSRAQLESSGRGFSFQKNEALDMRFDKSEPGITAKDIVNTWSEQELTRILKQYGEEPQARRIAQALVQARKEKPINTTLELSQIITQIVGQNNFAKIKKSGSFKGSDAFRSFRQKRSGKHPATRVFQALRLAVNNELENLKQTLPPAVKVLEPGGRLVVISYHSLEDRLVKKFFHQESRDCLCPPSFPICQCGHKATLKLLTKKPIIPTATEVSSNPRSRSAKLRVAQKLNK